ncbi:hypothetical protein ACFPM0_24650 [Pseudonocardia sulfidoxydans]|uniref:hypothetical protein n=1 Tax=Pseudonocardia sulfidoxydans TaxID=54011 RepID=UPI0036208A4E
MAGARSVPNFCINARAAQPGPHDTHHKRPGDEPTPRRRSRWPRASRCWTSCSA